MPAKPASTQLPKNWPTDIPYLTRSTYSPTLTPAHLTILHTRAPDTITIPPNTARCPSALTKVALIKTPTHPASGEKGLFATRDLKPGTFIIQYIGAIHVSASSAATANDPHLESNYDLSLDREHGIGIDSGKMGNEARFINDYRGVAERPNAEFREVWDERSGERGMGVWVLEEGKARWKGVRRGQEILVSYGRGFWGARRDADGGEE